MDVLVVRCAGLDVAKDEVVGCVRVPEAGKEGRRQEVRTFSTFTSGLESLADWLTAEAVTEVVMEATGQYWKPVVRHEALFDRGGMKGPPRGPSQRSAEAEGSPSLETKVRVGAAPTTTGRVGTARRPGSGKQDGKVYECRNQWSNPRKARTGSNLVDMGRIAAHARVTSVRVTPKPVDRAGGEAMRKACGVLMAMLPGKSWAPHPSNGQQ